MFLLSSASINLSTSSLARDINLSLAVFLAVFFLYIFRGHRKLLVVISFFSERAKRTDIENYEIDGETVVKSGAK